MEAKKLRIYDLDAFLRQECNKQAFRYHKVAIFEGKYGVVVAEEEAVHQKEAGLQSTIEIPANDIARPGHTWIMPSHLVTLEISDVKEAPYTEMTMEEFFHRRNYNPRCQTNWRVLLSSLDSIGFDFHDYLPSKLDLDKTIQSAEGKREVMPTDDKEPSWPTR